MFKGLFLDKPQSVVFKEAQEPTLEAHQVRIRSEFGAIKHGTEFHQFSGLSPHAGRRFDLGLRLFVPREDTGTFAQQYVGNMVVGTISEVGKAVTQFQPGERVYCYAPLCELVTKAEADVHPLLPPMSPQDAVCLDPAFYAFTAVRDTKLGLGDNLVVSGLGAIGLFIVQFLKMSGCSRIIAVDPIAKRRALAVRFGADLVLDPTQGDVGLAVRSYLGGQGADIAIEASGSYKALAGALRSVHQCARIVTLGFYKGRDTELELGAEWHHNRLEMISSMPVWGNPMRDYPNWTGERVERTLLDLFTRGRLSSDGIVDPIVDFSESAAAFHSIYDNPTDAIKLGVKF